MVPSFFSLFSLPKITVLDLRISATAIFQCDRSIYKPECVKMAKGLRGFSLARLYRVQNYLLTKSAPGIEFTSDSAKLSLESANGKFHNVGVDIYRHL